jgi:hypothetical protein
VKQAARTATSRAGSVSRVVANSETDVTPPGSAGYPVSPTLAGPVPPLLRPGSAWTELPRPVAASAAPAGHVRIGYARASTARQSLNPELDAPRASGVTRVFAEKISTRAVTRPERDKAVALHHRDQGMSLRDIAARLIIATGKKKGQHPSPATVMRMLREP